MYHWGDKEMSFSDAVLVLQHRVSEKDVAEDVYVAIRSLLKELPKELEKAKQCGYTEGYLAAEKEKDKTIDKIIENYEAELFILKSIVSENIENNDKDKR